MSDSLRSYELNMLNSPLLTRLGGFPGLSEAKNPPAKQKHGFDPLVGKIPLEKERATHFSVLA